MATSTSTNTPPNPSSRIPTEREERASIAVAHELVLHDDIPLLLSPDEWVETGAVEYRYGVAHPETYALMLDRWGHVAQSPRKYTVTSFIGVTLGHLSRATNVTHQSGPGTGFFFFNSRVGYWMLEPVAEEMTVVSWELLAVPEGYAPDQWPLV